MKTLKRTLGLFILVTLAMGNGMAQKARYTTNGGLTIGFGAGMAYQKSDLANSKGYGFDFILGSQLYKKENAFLSVDWKFRFLAGENKAYDHRINPDDTYSNIRYSFFTYDLELGLTLNRLRERTGIVLSGFAGAGLTHGRTFTDLYDAESSLYDFSMIDPNLDSKTIYTDLRTLSDGDFETALVNKVSVLPTAGFFLGYQFSRSFTMGVEFKTNFYLTEHNSFAGINLDNRDNSGSALDRNSYVSLGFRWKLRGGSSNYSTASASSQPISSRTKIESQAVTIPLPNPSVVITDPNADSVSTASNTHTLWANVNHVSGPENISIYQNGFPNHSFTYNASTKILIANLNLRNGENSIRIQATNQTAKAEDLVIITLDPDTSVEEVSTNEDITPVQHVGYKPKTYKPGSGSGNADVIQTNMDYSQYYTGYYQSGISQDQATIDIIEIPAENEAGSAQRTSINYDRPTERTYPVIKETRPCPPPVIRPIDPVRGQTSTDQQTYLLRAEVLNISSSDHLRLIVNGKPVSFSFNNNLLSSQVPLTSGLNTLSVSAINECGEDKASSRISFSPPELTEPCTVPEVSLALNQVNGRDASHEIRGSVTGVKNKADISLTLDGKAYNRFQFVPTRGDMTAKFKLTPGSHTIVVSVKNVCGTDSKNFTIDRVVPCTLPTVSLGLAKVDRSDATHEIRGSISGVKNKAAISLTLDGKAYNGFQFVPATGDLSAGLKLTPGMHTIVVSANNACGKGSDSESVSVEEEACGPRINPGNSDWQFCLVTPSGTFSRDNLSNPNFSYSGPATSLYFLPIGGGGDAMVNGSSYTIRSGRYYLFTGNLNVTVSTNNPGSMGHWSVCISADRAPVTGNGNSRPKSPCESQINDKSKEKEDKKPKANTDYSPKVNTEYSPKVNTGYSPNANNDDRSKASNDERSNRVAGERTKQTRTRR